MGVACAARINACIIFHDIVGEREEGESVGEGGWGSVLLLPAADLFFRSLFVREQEVFVNIAHHISVLFKQWITKRAQGIFGEREREGAQTLCISTICQGNK